MNKSEKISVSLVAVMVLFLNVLGVRADPYGADAITDLFSSLWNSFWPLVALFFIIVILLGIFGAPIWLKKVFGMAKNK